MAEQRVEKNKLVTFTYVISGENGETLEQSDIPHSYLHDHDDRMFPKVVHALEGHKVGDVLEVTLTPEEGFGYHDPALTYEDDLQNVPPEYQHPGAEATFRDATGESMTMRVTRIRDGRIELDGNPPFVGKTVTFIIKILEIRDAAGQSTAGPTQKTSLH